MMETKTKLIKSWIWNDTVNEFVKDKLIWSQIFDFIKELGIYFLFIVIGYLLRNAKQKQNSKRGYQMETKTEEGFKHNQPCDCDICFYQKQERQKAERFKEEVSRQLFSGFEHTDNDFIDRTIKEVWEEIYDEI